MAVYVDDVAISYGRMKMCHLWADTEAELMAMVDAIGVARKWVQKPPKASWLHFDVCLAKKRLAIEAGAVLTDQFGPAEHVAKLTGNAKMLAMIAESRRRRSEVLA